MMPSQGDSPPQARTLLELKGIVRTFDEGRVQAVHRLDLTIETGEFIAIVGRSGSGKSTLLHLMAGIERPSAGCIRFEDKEPRRNGDWAALRARRIGLVFQRDNLLPTLSALENLEIPMIGVESSEARRRVRVRDLLERVGLGHRADHKPRELSGGERQRLAIARSLVNGPALVLADEPTGNLDSANAREVMALLRSINEDDGTALVVVTHDKEIAACARRRLYISDGRLVLDSRFPEHH